MQAGVGGCGYVVYDIFSVVTILSFILLLADKRIQIEDF